MSRGETLKALVNERLAAAAEEIFALFERTIAEYEEELRCAKTENQQQNQTPTPVELNIVVQTSPDPELNEESTEKTRIKDEPEVACVVKEEEEFVFDPWFVPISADKEDAQTPSKEEPQEKHTNDDNYEACEHSPPRRKKRRSTRRSSDQTSAPETTKNTATNQEPEGDPCPVCHERFRDERSLQKHVEVHAEQGDYDCPVCGKQFERKCFLSAHVRTHTGEKPFRCSICKKTCAQSSNLRTHMRSHFTTLSLSRGRKVSALKKEIALKKKSVVGVGNTVKNKDLP